MNRFAARAALALCVLSACTGRVEVDLTVDSSALGDETMARIASLEITLSDVLSASKTYTNPFAAGREERIQIFPYVASGELGITATARDANGDVVAFGESAKAVLRKATLAARIELAAGSGPLDMSVTDGGADLSVADLAAPLDLSQPDLAPHVDPYLTDRAISGATNAMKAIEFQGFVPDLRLVFRNSANEAIHSSTVSVTGDVTLPAHAGIYRTELVDLFTGKISYGTATVNDAFTSWDPASTALDNTFGVLRGWPATTVATGDIDHDGTIDVAFASGTLANGTLSNPGVHIYSFSGTTQAFSETQYVTSTAAVMAAGLVDINGDGWLDLVYTAVSSAGTIANVTDQLFVALNDQTGMFGAPSTTALPPPSTPGVTYFYQLKVADFNRDGKNDVVMIGGARNMAAWTAGLVYVLIDDGEGGFAVTPLETPGTQPFYSVDIADANVDGKLDLYMSGGPSLGLTRYYQQALGEFSKTTAGVDHDVDVTPHGNFATDQLRVGYLYGHTRPEVVIVHPDGPSALMMASSASNALTGSVIPAPSTNDQHGNGPAIADLTGDGIPEIYIPLKNRALYANRPGVHIRTTANLTTVAAANSTNTIIGVSVLASWALANIYFEDFNGDGKIDLFMPVAEISKTNIVFAN